GAARGNPGPAGAGAVLYDREGRVVAELTRALGWATNNVAEYSALILGLEEAKRRGATSIDVRMDSLLVVEQMRGRWRIKHPGLKRLPPNDSLEVQLLPFLARKTDRVPAVHARGVPPPAAAGWPWILIEDLLDARSACNGDPLAIIRAKAAVERGVAGNEPALGALGVRRVTPIELVERASERTAIDRPIDVDARAAATYLSRLPVVLCQGELTCASARLTDRGVVLVEWRRAYLGC